MLLKKWLCTQKEAMTLFVYDSDLSKVNAASKLRADFVIIIIKKC